jgi:hypothetical protein
MEEQITPEVTKEKREEKERAREEIWLIDTKWRW